MSCLLTAHANSLHGTIETMSRKLKCSHAKSNAAKRKEDECDSVTIRGSRIVERKNVVKIEVFAACAHFRKYLEPKV
jgi:hypothetical protein